MAIGDVSPYDLLVQRVDELERRVKALEARGASYGRLDQVSVSFNRPQPEKPFFDGMGVYHDSGEN